MPAAGTVARIAAAFTATVLLGLGAAQAEPAKKPAEAAASVKMSGRTAVIALPYKASDKLVWVSATKMMDASPFTFKGLEIRPGAGPGGQDLAVFTYAADKAGSATLTFGLVPPGKMLIGPPTMVYKGPVARTLSVKVTAQ